MTVHIPIQHGTSAPRVPSKPAHRFRVTTVVLGLVGAIATFLGAFVLLAGDDQWIGLGGEVSWRVGDIDPAWGYGLLIGGGLILLATVALAIRDRAAPVAAATEPSGWADVATHAAVFLAVNTLLWAQDFATGDGLNYALWVTIPWGIGLGVHAMATYAEQRRAHTRV
jgi:hypothetical protein